MDPAPDALVALDLAVAPEEAAALRRHLALGRARPVCATWHDDAQGTLAQRGLALTAWREGRASTWRVAAIVPGPDHAVPTGAPAPVLVEAAELSGLDGIDLPDRLVTHRRLDGRVRAGDSGGVALRLLDGRLEDGAAVARLTAAGPGAAVCDLLLDLAATHRLDVPARNLAADLLAGGGVAVPPPRLGAPQLRGSLPPGDAFAEAAAHLLGVLLHHAPAAGAGRTGEPVHQMRVALRRLRALAAVFGPVVDCPEVRALRPELKALAGALGPARDWDVFLAGTGQAVAEAFAGEPALAVLLAEAEARRDGAYAALATLLEGPALRMMAIRLAVLAQARPWREAESAPPEEDTGSFGAALLARRWRRLSRRAGDIPTMPEAELHALRLKAKRLRYAAELFAPLHPGRGGRRFLKRLAGLQEALGHLNDGVVAGGLMHELAGAGGTGLAGGLVRGFVAGRAADARAEIRRAWRRLRKVGPFWG